MAGPRALALRRPGCSLRWAGLGATGCCFLLLTAVLVGSFLEPSAAANAGREEGTLRLRQADTQGTLPAQSGETGGALRRSVVT